MYFLSICFCLVFLFLVFRYLFFFFFFFQAEDGIRDWSVTGVQTCALPISTVRTVFVIGPDKKIKLMLSYPMSTGRNFDEVLRVLDSIQLTAKHQVATPRSEERRVGKECRYRDAA